MMLMYNSAEMASKYASEFTAGSGNERHGYDHQCPMILGGKIPRQDLNLLKDTMSMFYLESDKLT